MKNKKILWILIGLVLALVVTDIYFTQYYHEDVESYKLVDHPEDYNGKRVCTEGKYVKDFEVNALIGAVLPCIDEPLLLGCESPVIYIWLENPDITELENSMARVCGTFEYGEKYGHLGGYDYQISETITPTKRLAYFFSALTGEKRGSGQINLSESVKECISKNENEINYKYSKGELIVDFNQNLSEEQVNNFLKSFVGSDELSLSDRYFSSSENRRIIRVPEGTEIEWMCKFRENNLVEAVYLDRLVYAI